LNIFQEPSRSITVHLLHPGEETKEWCCKRPAESAEQKNHTKIVDPLCMVQHSGLFADFLS
jgi:hypothetical protein